MKNALKASLKYILVYTLILGLIYPVATLVVAQLIFPYQTLGSIVRDSDGKARGSELIAQKFEDPRYFFPRPSNVDFHADNSGGTNLSLTHKDFRKRAQEVTYSASGLDPDISPEYANSQVSRIAEKRKISVATLHELIVKSTQGRCVNVLNLNLQLDHLAKH